jgi:hypothetical protein
MLCEQARTTIDHGIDVFLQTQIVNSQVIREEVFQSKMNSLIESWKNSTISQYERRMELIRITTLANQLMNRLNIFFQYELGGRKIYTEPRNYNGMYSKHRKKKCRTKKIERKKDRINEN